MGHTNKRCTLTCTQKCRLISLSCSNRLFPRYSVDARKLHKKQKPSLKDFFNLESKAAACILCSKVLVAHWKNINNNN